MTSDHRAFRDKQQLYDFSSDLILTTDGRVLHRTWWC